jgi:predicted Ser/Thr protein kinase
MNVINVHGEKVKIMHTDRCGKTRRQKCCAKGGGKEVKIQEFIYRNTTNVEPEIYDYTSNNWSTGRVTRSLRKNLEAVPGKHSIDSLQKTAILGTSHILRKVLQCEA